MGKFLNLSIIFVLLSVGFMPRSVEGKELHLITSSSIAPFVLAEENSGIVVDIITKALSVKGHTTKFTFAPNLRVVEEMKQGKVDGAFNAPNVPNAFYSDTVVEFLDGIVSLKHRQLKIESVNDLKELRIAAFQNAANFLTPEFAEMTKINSKYLEVDLQLSQLPMLYTNRTDALVIDLNIFLYHRANPDRAFANIDMSADYVFHPLFEPFPQYAAFIDEDIRNDFNEGLKTIRDNGEYEKIFNKYTLMK